MAANVVIPSGMRRLPKSSESFLAITLAEPNSAMVSADQMMSAKAAETKDTRTRSFQRIEITEYLGCGREE